MVLNKKKSKYPYNSHLSLIMINALLGYKHPLKSVGVYTFTPF